MPSFYNSSTVQARSDHFSLSLNAKHCVVLGNPSDIIHNARHRVPDDIDVLLLSDLLITFSGSMDRVKMSHQQIYGSAVASHFAQYLTLNASQLGINTVSDIYVDKYDSLPKLTITPSRALAMGTRPPSVNLISIDLTFAWKTRSFSSEKDQTSDTDTAACEATHPFSSNLLLPFQGILNQVIEKFVTYHLVRRYPLVFGMWVQVLSFPRHFTRNCNSSIRSRNPSSSASFVHRDELICPTQTLLRDHATAFKTSSTSLANYLSRFEDDDECVKEVMEFSKCTTGRLADQEAICLAFEHIFRIGVRRPLFKGSSLSFNTTTSADSDSDSLNQQSLPAYNPVSFLPESIDDLDLDDLSHATSEPDDSTDFDSTLDYIDTARQLESNCHSDIYQLPEDDELSNYDVLADYRDDKALEAEPATIPNLNPEDIRDIFTSVWVSQSGPTDWDSDSDYGYGITSSQDTFVDHLGLEDEDEFYIEANKAERRSRLDDSCDAVHVRRSHDTSPSLSFPPLPSNPVPLQAQADEPPAIFQFQPYDSPVFASIPVYPTESNLTEAGIFSDEVEPGLDIIADCFSITQQLSDMDQDTTQDSGAHLSSFVPTSEPDSNSIFTCIDQEDLGCSCVEGDNRGDGDHLNEDIDLLDFEDGL